MNVAIMISRYGDKHLPQSLAILYVKPDYIPPYHCCWLISDEIHQRPLSTLLSETKVIDNLLSMGAADALPI